jgi:protease I
MSNSDIVGHAPALQGRTIGVLIESDYYEPEIFYYQRRFAEEGADVVFLSRLWDQESQTFSGHEFRAPFVCRDSFEGIDDRRLREFAAIIVPSGMVADRLRYTEDTHQLPPATQFLRRAFIEPDILKGIICHGMWLVAPAPELVRGRRVVVHNNLLGDIRNMRADYVDEDVVVDGDLVTGRTGAHCHLFARTIIDMLAARRVDGASGNGLPRGHSEPPAGDELPRGLHGVRA